MPTVFLTSGTSYTVPADWSNGNNSIECVGAGGAGGGGWYDGGGSGDASDYAGSGGGGGAYAAVFNLALNPGDVITYQVGVGGAGPTAYNAAGAAGTDTWFNGATFAASSVGAKGGPGGNGGQSANPVSGGQASASIGTLKYSGGYSAGAGQYPIGGSGGGAAGPSGAGGTGGRPGGTYAHPSNGMADGGTVKGYVNVSPWRNGASGTEWDSTHGCGASGKGSNYADAGRGGDYGGGGGGWAYAYGGTYNNRGGHGLIIIRYYPAYPEAAMLIGT